MTALKTRIDTHGHMGANGKRSRQQDVRTFSEEGRAMRGVGVRQASPVHLGAEKAGALQFPPDQRFKHLMGCYIVVKGSSDGARGGLRICGALQSSAVSRWFFHAGWPCPHARSCVLTQLTVKSTSCHRMANSHARGQSPARPRRPTIDLGATARVDLFLSPMPDGCLEKMQKMGRLRS